MKNRLELTVILRLNGKNYQYDTSGTFQSNRIKDRIRHAFNKAKSYYDKNIEEIDDNSQANKS